MEIAVQYINRSEDKLAMLDASGKARSGLSIESDQTDSFVHSAYLELKRAERYRLFLSIVTLDLGILGEADRVESSRIPLDELLDEVRDSIRAVDLAGLIGHRRLTILLPETGRQGASVAARRVTERVRNRLSEHSRVLRDQVIPLEMASYPDAAGTRSVRDLLEELRRVNMK